MITKSKKYSGVVAIGSTYVSPAGVECVPTQFVMAGIVVQFTGGNFAFTRVVRRADFAAYVQKEKV